MDRGIWAIWYNLPEEGRNEYLAWLHEVYLPEALQRPGYLWAAHYQSHALGSILHGGIQFGFRLPVKQAAGHPFGRAVGAKQVGFSVNLD